MDTNEDFDGFQSQLQLDFMDRVSDEVLGLSKRLSTFKADQDTDGSEGSKLLARTRRFANSVKGGAAASDLPIPGLIAHRLEDYVSDLLCLGKREIDDIQIFIDRIQDILDAERDVTNADMAQAVRGLPVRMGEFDPDSVTWVDVEVLLVMPKGVATNFVERELQACGYRVFTTSAPFTAMEMVVRAQPDLVVINLTLDGLSGVDMANAIRAMSVSEGIPVTLLTSMDRTASDIKGLHGSVPVVQKGERFSDDFADALSRLKIT